jgi:hypothetical protein
MMVGVLAAVSLSACGVAAKPVAGSAEAKATASKNITDPATKHLKCLAKHHVMTRQYMRDDRTVIQVKTRPAGPTIVFYPTPGAAQYEQIAGQSQGAEVIGAALVYDNQAPNKLLSTVENCVAEGVSG